MEINEQKLPLIIMGCVFLGFIVFAINGCFERNAYINDLRFKEIHGNLVDSVKRARPLQSIQVKNVKDSIEEYDILLQIPYLFKNDSIAKSSNSDSMNFYRKINGENILIYVWIVEPL
jgi:hypothetical protein